VEIDGYEIVERIGRGGMGSVYRARQLNVGGRVVALKLIDPVFADDESFRSRFRSEMKVASSLEHPNVVPVYEAKEADGQPYIAMALIPGEDLGSLIRREGRLDPDLSVRIVAQIASALDAAHDQGVIHRDVKPANILIDRRVDHAYLSDFGIAKSVEASRADTRTGQGLGSLGYIAPEQLEGHDPDPRSDVYALGCVLFQCLTGELPFRDGHDAFLLRQKLESDPRHPSDLSPDLDPAFDRVSDLALARNPGDRFQSAGELAEAARAALSGESPTRPMNVGTTGARTTKLPDPGGGNSPTEVQPQSPVAKRRFGPVALAALGVAALLIAGFAISMVGGGDDAADRAGVARTASGGSASDSGSEGEGSDGAAEVGASDASPLNLEPVETTLYSAEVPVGWSTEMIDERNSARFTSEWSDSADPGTSVLIDAQSPGPSVGALDSAREVRAETSQSTGYSEIAFREIRIAGRPTAEWIFDLPEGRKVDYFFAECNVGVAVLGTAPATRFDQMRPTFRKVAASVVPRCQPLSARSPISTEGIGPVLVGMTESEAERAGDFELTFDGFGTGQCKYLTSDAVKDVGFMFNKGTLARIDTTNPNSETISGVSVGDSEADVYEAYGDQIEREANYYDPENASYLTYVPEDPADKTRVLFDVNDGQIINIRAGRLPEINYVEGCA
jgi:serine/threonine-protein kinase